MTQANRVEHETLVFGQVRPVWQGIDRHARRIVQAHDPSRVPDPHGCRSVHPQDGLEQREQIGLSQRAVGIHGYGTVRNGRIDDVIELQASRQNVDHIQEAGVAEVAERNVRRRVLRRLPLCERGIG